MLTESSHAKLMPSERDKSKRWWPRWSVRMLLIVVALLCAYLAGWGRTASDGVRDVEMRLLEGTTGFDCGSSPCPLVVSIDEHAVGYDATGNSIFWRCRIN